MGTAVMPSSTLPDSASVLTVLPVTSAGSGVRMTSADSSARTSATPPPPPPRTRWSVDSQASCSSSTTSGPPPPPARQPTVPEEKIKSKRRQSRASLPQPR